MQARMVGKAAVLDRCELCGAKAPATFVGRTRHLRQEHPAYARGLLLRILSPVAFLVAIVALQASGAPAWTVVPAAVLSGGLAIAGLWMGRVARAETGGGKQSFRTLLKEGGYRFVLLAVVFAVMVILAATTR